MKRILAAVLFLQASGAAAMDVAVEESSRTTQVSADFATSAPCDSAWAVLTDYDGIDGFVSSMKESRVESREPEGTMVVQRARAGFLLASRTVEVRLRVTESPKKRIEFKDESLKDFERYEGSWELDQTPEGCEVSYELTGTRRFNAPAWAARGVSHMSVRGLLKDVRREIERRNDDEQAMLEREKTGEGGK